MKPILIDSSEEILRSGDLKTVGEGLAAQILTLRGLTASRPGDVDIRSMTVQLHLFYANGFIESVDHDHASALYREGRDIGLEHFRRIEGFPEALRAGDLALRPVLAKVSEREAPLLLWTASCWGGWIRLHLSDPDAVADLPLVEAMLDRTLELDPDYFHGMPWIMRGTMAGLRPPALGGKPENALAAFEKGFAASDREYLLGLVYFARTYCRQIFDRDLFEAALREVAGAPPDLLPDVRLLNVMAKEQAAYWLTQMDEIF
jgi:hypothetical protein